MAMDKKKKSFHETVAENLIRQLEQGTAPWQRPWEPGASGSLLPFNPITGKRYKGINALLLMAQERCDQRWMTYKQAESLGYQVRKGEKGTGIQYWKFTEEQFKKDDQGKAIRDHEGNPIKITVKLERPRVFYSTVFNAEQIDGMPPLEKKVQTWDSIERAEAILTASGAVIHYKAGGRAFYRPSSDTIHLPEKSQFPSAAKFYATALHELGHWSGAASRLNRDLSHPFGSEGYAKEELKAEIASMILGDELGIGHDPGQHAAYVGSWIKVLQDDPLELFRAGADAERIQDYVLGLEQNLEQHQSQNQVETLSATEDVMTAKNNVEPTALNTTAINSKEHTGNQATDRGTAQVRGDKLYIKVPFKKRHQAKVLGAKWDRRAQSWSVPEFVDLTPFAQWAKTDVITDPDTEHADQSQAVATDMTVRQYLAVPYIERAVARTAGARWDKKAKSWYAVENANMSILKQWLPDHVSDQQIPAMSTQEEFTEALASLGCIVNGEHPMMDGQAHRIATVGDKFGEKAGFYVAHLDGHPAGYIQNNRTGESLKWKSKGYSLTKTEKKRLRAGSAAKLQAREAAQKARQDQVAYAVRELLSVAPFASPDHPYLLSKQARPGDLRVVPDDVGALPANTLIMIGKDWKESNDLRDSHPDKLVFSGGDLLLSAQDINGEVRSVQAIQANGTKRFAAGGAKQDTFHFVGGRGLADLKKSPAIVIGEGYATADTLSQVLGYATVAAFDSGNLPRITVLLRDKFPDKPFIIAGDNDLHLELTEGRNPGKEKAQAAAKAVNGTAIFPIFAPGEHAYPENLEPVTPAKARSGDLNDGQKAAIAEMKNFTDFNDLATKSKLGMGGVERQVVNIVNSIIERKKEQAVFNQQQAFEESHEQQTVRRKAVNI